MAPAALRCVQAYSCYDTEVGYCQGSAFIVALLLMRMPEEEAFNVFRILMRHFRLRGLFRPSMAELTLRLYQFEALVAELFPELHDHFEDMSVRGTPFVCLSPPPPPVPPACPWGDGARAVYVYTQSDGLGATERERQRQEAGTHRVTGAQ